MKPKKRSEYKPSLEGSLKCVKKEERVSSGQETVPRIDLVTASWWKHLSNESTEGRSFNPSLRPGY